MVLERRVKLSIKENARIFNLVVQQAGSLLNFSKKYNISYSMLKRYKNNELLLPENVFDILLKFINKDKSNISVAYFDANWGRKKGAKKGMAALEKKYPFKLRLWRKKALIKFHFSNLKKINFPGLNEDLSELVGAYIGDGTLTKYYIRISGDYRYDIPYYNYLNKLVYNLFGISGVIYKDKNSNVANIAFFSKNLCDFFREKFNFKNGDKLRNNTIIPSQILKNKSYSLACLRGLVDTDGCISRRGRNGSQFTIVFTSHNPYLIDQVEFISKKYKLFSFLSKSRDTIGTNSKSLIYKYFKLVGSSNLRHIIRFYQRFFKNEIIYQKDVVLYIQKTFYKQLNLPFKI